MEMTYAALAKSLGISLKPTSSASNTSSRADALPGSALGRTTRSETTNEPSRDEGSKDSSSNPNPTVDSNRPVDEKVEAKSSEDTSTIEQAPGNMKGSSNTDSTEPVGETIKILENSDAAVTEDPGSDADAEGISDSDIASSRPSSPNLAPTQEGSLDENKSDLAPQPRQAELPSRSEAIENALNESEKSAQTNPRETMSDEDLHHAKVLVLDLLGWGVPPEYLLQRGISHALLYTVFTDLRLRLPDAIFEDCVKLVSAQS